MKKEIPIDRLSIKDVQYENIEAIGLSYILVSIIILFLFDEINTDLINREDVFDLEKWISVMQNSLANLPREIFGWLHFLLIFDSQV